MHVAEDEAELVGPASRRRHALEPEVELRVRAVPHVAAFGDFGAGRAMGELGRRIIAVNLDVGGVPVLVRSGAL